MSTSELTEDQKKLIGRIGFAHGYAGSNKDNIVDGMSPLYGEAYQRGLKQFDDEENNPHEPVCAKFHDGYREA